MGCKWDHYLDFQIEIQDVRMFVAYGVKYYFIMYDGDVFPHIYHLPTNTAILMAINAF